MKRERLTQGAEWTLNLAVRDQVLRERNGC